MKNLLLIFLLLVSVSPCIAQYTAHQRDSMLQLLKSVKSDTVLVNTMNELSQYYAKTEKDISRKYLEKALTLADRIQYWKGIIYAHMYTGHLHTAERETENALHHYSKALQISERTHYTRGISWAYYNMAIAQHNASNYQLSSENFSAAYASYELENDKVGMAICALDLGDAYYHLGKTNAAYVEYKKAESICQEIGNKRGLAKVKKNIGRYLVNEANLEEALIYQLDACKLYEEIGDLEEVRGINHYLGYIYWQQGKMEAAEKCYLVYLAHARETRNKSREISAHDNLIRLYRHMGNYTTALQYAQSGYQLAQKNGNLQGISTACSRLGEIYSSLGNHPLALEWFFAALKVTDAKEMISPRINALSQISNLYRILLKYNEAFQYGQLALELARKTDLKNTLADVLLSIGHTYNDTKDYSMAEKCYLESLTLFEELGKQGQKAKCRYHLGVIKHRNMEYGEAIAYFKQALEIYQEFGSAYDLSHGHTNIGETYRAIGDFANSKKHLEEGLRLARQISSKSLLKNVYRELAMLDSATGNWESAFLHRQLSLTYRDSIFNAENDKKIYAAQLQYQFSSKEDSLRYQRLLSEESLTRQILLTDQQHQSLLLSEKELGLLSKEKEFNDLALTKSQLELDIENAETARRQDQITLKAREAEINALESLRQRTAKNYWLVGILILFCLAAFLYRTYLTRQEIRLQQLRNKIASDLNEDVGSTLSSISIFAEMARKQSAETIPLLDVIDENSQKMLDAMADIVWTINPENDDVGKILDRMRSFAYELLGAKKIDFEFEADGHLHQLKLPMEVRKNLFLIFKEATNNMVKYAAANKAHFVIQQDRKQLRMLIRDNGKGFDTNQLSSGNGLRNMKKRAEEIGGELRIESRRDEGTTVRLSIAV